MPFYDDMPQMEHHLIVQATFASLSPLGNQES